MDNRLKSMSSIDTTTYENNVRVEFDWVSTTEEEATHGDCNAYVDIVWDARIERSWKHLMNEEAWGILYPQHEMNDYGTAANAFLREINELHDDMDVDIESISGEASDETENRFLLIICAHYLKEGSQAKWQKIQRDFKRYVGDIMSGFMQALLSPPHTYDDEFDDEDERDGRQDYTLRTTEIYNNNTWDEAIEAMVNDTFRVTFELVHSAPQSVSTYVGENQTTQFTPLRF